MQGEGFDVRGVCVCGDDSERTGRENATGTVVGRTESEDDEIGEAEVCARDLGGHLCQSFCLDIGLASHAGDVVAWEGVEESVCKSDCRTSICPNLGPRRGPMVAAGPCHGRGLCPSCVRQAPSCPCDDARGHLVDGGHETWACRGDSRRPVLGHDAV